MAEALSNDPTVSSPLWLEYSGLPAYLGQKIKGGAGWPVLKKITELDCAANGFPDTVEIGISELAERSGVAAGAARKALLSLRKLKLVACFLPETDEEVALLKVRVPLPVPLSRDEMLARWPGRLDDLPAHWRYLDPVGGESSDDLDGRDRVLQEVVDLYFNAVGLKMNAFVLDELRLLRQQFPIEQVRKVFRRAQVNEIRSLHWILRELVRARKKDEKKDS
ncbi:MAG: hypothetical protein K1X53_11560 [Candidatus Sumerlaeaceae bacterium]|nr:hypothetical protein [Candidatus Sumerlaeaceae bacterium]